MLDDNGEEKDCEEVRELHEYVAEAGGGGLVSGGCNHRTDGHPVRSGPVVEPHQAGCGHWYHEFPAQLKEQRRGQQREAGPSETPLGNSPMAQSGRNDWRSEAADGGDDIDPSGKEVGACDSGDAGKYENNRKIEAECREFDTLHRVGDPGEDAGPPADRILPDVGQEVAGAWPADTVVLVGQHIQRVVKHVLGHLLSLFELARLNQRERRVRDVEPHYQQDQRWNRAQGPE